MGHADEDRANRYRLAKAASRVDNLRRPTGEDAPFFVGSTANDPGGSPYPTAPAAVYAVAVFKVTGEDAEGGDVVVTPTGVVAFAANAGSAVPPPGTVVRCYGIPAPVFVYNG